MASSTLTAHYLPLLNFDFFRDFDEVSEFCAVTDNFVSYKAGVVTVVVNGEDIELSREDVLIRACGKLSVCTPRTRLD